MLLLNVGCKILSKIITMRIELSVQFYDGILRNQWLVTIPIKNSTQCSSTHVTINTSFSIWEYRRSVSVKNFLK